MGKYNIFVHTDTHAGNSRVAFDYGKAHASLAVPSELGLNDQQVATVAKLYADQVVSTGNYEVNVYTGLGRVSSEQDTKLGTVWTAEDYDALNY